MLSFFCKLSFPPNCDIAYVLKPIFKNSYLEEKWINVE